MLLFLWAAWFSVVFASNACDALKALNWLPESWAFASGNYDFLVQSTARYTPPSWVNGLLFAGVIAWEAAAALLFWRAALRPESPPGAAAARLAFALGFGLWGAFLFADEICMTFDVERAHMGILTAQLATFLVVELLPSRAASPGSSGSRS